MLESQKKSNGERAEQGKVVKTVRATEKDLYTSDTWSLLITGPCDYPRGVLLSSVSLSLPGSVHACLCGCCHAVCVSQRVKYTGIGSGVCVCTWTFFYLTFLQANNLRCKMTV